LRENGIDAGSHIGAGWMKNSDSPVLRERLETRLLRNELKALVATTALGMASTNPISHFVIHYQLPGSVVHYYQQVGRAGARVADAFAVLLAAAVTAILPTTSSRPAFPPRELVEKILAQLDAAPQRFHARRTANSTERSAWPPGSRAKIAFNSNRPRRCSSWTIVGTHRRALAPTFGSASNGSRNFANASKPDGRIPPGAFLPHAIPRPRTGRTRRAAMRTLRCLFGGEPLLPNNFLRRSPNAPAQFLPRTHHPIKPRRLWPKDAFSTYQSHGKSFRIGSARKTGSRAGDLGRRRLGASWCARENIPPPPASTTVWLPRRGDDPRMESAAAAQCG